MESRIQFMKFVGEKLVPVKKLSPKIMKKIDPEMRHYINGLRRANRCHPNETKLTLHAYEYDGNIGIAINGQTGNDHVCNFTEQGRSDLRFTTEELRRAIKNTETSLKNWIG